MAVKKRPLEAFHSLSLAPMAPEEMHSQEEDSEMEDPAHGEVGHSTETYFFSIPQMLSSTLAVHVARTKLFTAVSYCN